AVQVHRRAAVGRQHFAPLADLRPRSTVFHLGVFLCQSLHFFLRVALDDWLAEVLRDGLAAGVEDVVAGPAADGPAEDPTPTGELGPHRVIGAVHQQERAGLDLRHAVVTADDRAGAGARPGNDLDRDTVRLQQPPGPDQLLQRLQTGAALRV